MQHQNNNILLLNYKFNTTLLLDQFVSVFDKKWKPINCNNEWNSGFYVTPFNDIMKEEADKFLSYYNINNLIINEDYFINFFYIEPYATLDWHIDEGDVLCSINALINDNLQSISFKDESIFYKTALLNIRHMHKVESSTKERIVFRITLKKQPYTYEYTKNIILNS